MPYSQRPFPVGFRPVASLSASATPPLSNPKPTSLPIIAQEMLSEIETCRAAKRRYDELRTTVLDLCEQGAVVEPGPLDIKIEIIETHRLSAKNLEKLLGSQQVAALKSAVELTTTRQLTIVKRHEQSRANFDS